MLVERKVMDWQQDEDPRAQSPEAAEMAQAVAAAARHW
jgi:hypothetical protein